MYVIVNSLLATLTSYLAYLLIRLYNSIISSVTGTQGLSWIRSSLRRKIAAKIVAI